MFSQPMLIIIDNSDPEIPLRDREHHVPVLSFAEDDALEIGARWISAYPDDIVMWVIVEHSICKHCDGFIHENPGWILHKWVHDRGGRICFNDELTKAEPV